MATSSDPIIGIFTIFRGIDLSTKHTLQQKVQLLCSIEPNFSKQIISEKQLHNSCSIHPLCNLLIKWHVIPPAIEFYTVSEKMLVLIQSKISIFNNQWLHQFWFDGMTGNGGKNNYTSLEKMEHAMKMLFTIIPVKCSAQQNLVRQAYQLCRSLLATIGSMNGSGSSSGGNGSSNGGGDRSSGRMKQWSPSISHGLAVVLFHTPQWDDYITTLMLHIGPEWVHSMNMTNSNGMQQQHQQQYLQQQNKILQFYIHCCERACKHSQTSVVINRASTMGMNVLKILGAATSSPSPSSSLPSCSMLIHLINILPPIILPTISNMIISNSTVYNVGSLLIVNLYSPAGTNNSFFLFALLYFLCLLFECRFSI
jgi:hypothetical protein